MARPTHTPDVTVRRMGAPEHGTSHWYPCVVVVDDDHDFVEMLRIALTRAGCCVHPVTRGADALTVMDQVPVDLLVMDMGMPGLSGLDVLGAMSRNAWLRSVPVIVVSGRDRRGEVDRGLTAGATAYLTKPISPRELVARIHEVLDRGR